MKFIHKPDGTVRPVPMPSNDYRSLFEPEREHRWAMRAAWVVFIVGMLTGVALTLAMFAVR